MLLSVFCICLYSGCLLREFFTIIQKIRKKEFKRYYAGITAVVFTVCYLGAGWYCAHHVWQTSYEIQTDKSVGNLKVAVFSDSHVGATFDGEGFAGHMKEIEAQKSGYHIDLGDFVDDDYIESGYGKGMPGTWRVKMYLWCVLYLLETMIKGYYPSDYRGYSGADLKENLEKNNVHVMEDDVELIDNRFYIIGRADKSEEYGAGRKNMEELVKDLDPDKFSIVLDHQPEDYASQADSGVDLVLSGHTHGGQLFRL